MPENKPMKGLHVMLNQDLLDFLWEARKEIDDIYTDELNEKNPATVLVRLGKIGWTTVSDKFGTKAYKSVTYPASNPPLSTDELRVTLINRKGALYLDIRPWGQY